MEYSQVLMMLLGPTKQSLIKNFADLSKKNASEYYTPRTIVKLMIMLMNPNPGDTVYDSAWRKDETEKRKL